jgi:hypothetical protein
MSAQLSPITQKDILARKKCDPSKQKAIRKEMSTLYGRIANGVKRRQASSWTTTREY